MITGVHLITGLIGSGKTLRMVDLIHKEIEAGRAVYACNINGLNIPGVIPWEDPRAWQDLPPGALLVVDEAQRFWRARRTAEVPAELQAMETSRHDGVAFLLATQQPTYLDKHLRGLVTRHEHLYRRLGLNGAQLFRWERCVDDPQGQTDKDGAEQEFFAYPKKRFDSYKSAEVHTVKRNIGTRGKLIIAAFGVAAACVGWVVWQVSTDTDAGTAQAAESSPGLSAQPTARTDSVAPAPKSQPMTVEEYVARMIPRIETAPWSAPIYDARRAVAEPRVFCMSSEAGEDANGRYRGASVSCITEQGTPHAMDDKAARMLALRGEVYNPFKRPDAQQRATAAAPRQAAPDMARRGPSGADRVAGALIEGTPYGALGMDPDS